MSFEGMVPSKRREDKGNFEIGSNFFYNKNG